MTVSPRLHHGSMSPARAATSRIGKRATGRSASGPATDASAPRTRASEPDHRRQTSQLMSVTTRSPDRIILYEAIVARLRRADESVPDVVFEAVDEAGGDSRA